MEKSQYKGIWIFAEHRNGCISNASLELIGKAATLKNNTDDTVTALLLGHNAEPLCKELIYAGADDVVLVDTEKLKVYKTIPYADVSAKIVHKYKPSIFLFPATSIGKDLAPRIMAKLQTGLTADCLDLEIDSNGTLIQTKPSYGGNIMCTIVVPEHRPQMATVRPKVFEVPEPDTSREIKIIHESIQVEDDTRTEIIGEIKKNHRGTPIEKAQIVVSCGRGLENVSHLCMFKELADLINGQIACSRPLVDESWMSHEFQIGQSGTTVKPALLFNTAISGSVQYLVGMSDAKCIISVNQNANAPIFEVSHYGAVADYKQLIPAIIAEIKKRTKKQ